MKLRMLMPVAMAASTLLASAAFAATAPGIPEGWSDGYVYANGARLHYYRAVPQAGKPAMIMVHGVSDNGLSWTTLTKDLQDSYDIYMIDARAHGLSDPLSDSDAGDTMVKDLVAFIGAMKLERPILMGHSMGAAIVMRLGATYPDLPRAVIMLDPGLPRPVATAGQAAPAPVARPAAAAAPATPAPARRPGSVSLFGAPDLLVAQNNDPYDALLAACGRQNVMWDLVDCQYWALSKQQYHGPYSQTQMAAMRGLTPPADALPRITAPALILKADATPEVRQGDLAAAAVMKTGKLVHIEGSNHNLHHDKRARTVELLKTFLSGV